MPTVADVMRRYGQSYVERFGDRMPAAHHQVLRMLMACRTGALGTVLYRCSSCSRVHAMGRSCGNRHCPSCQHGKIKQWLHKQTARLLPCPYFLMTFTLPASLRQLARSQQRELYAALFEASSATIKLLTSNPRHVGSDRCGFFGALHTWGRALGYHPHIHYVIPGGAVSRDGSAWLPSHPEFFVPAKAASVVFRAKFKDAMARAGLLSQIDPAVWRCRWVVDARAVGDGRASLKYLAPYVFRVAISDRRIVACGDGKVTFSYRPSGEKHWRRMTLDAHEFIRRFLQHVLPRGFQKIRHYGFAAANAKLSIEAVRWLVTLHYDEPLILNAKASEVPLPVASPAAVCPACGAALVMVRFLAPARVAWTSRQPSCHTRAPP